MESEVNTKLDREFYAVLVRSCYVTNAIDTMLFASVDMAKAYCEARWKIPLTDWDAYMVASDKKSSMKLNGEPVSHCGWKHSMDETEELFIHLERKIVDFHTPKQNTTGSKA